MSELTAFIDEGNELTAIALEPEELIAELSSTLVKMTSINRDDRL